MNIGWFLRDLWEGIRGAPLRTGLTLVSVSTGVLSLSMLLSILRGLQERAEEVKKEIGAEEIWVGGTLNDTPFLTESDMNRLSSIFPAAHVSGVRVGNPVEGPEGIRIQPVGGNADMAHVRGWKLKEGRFLDPMDPQSDASVGVAGIYLAEKLGLHPGMRLVIENESVTIVGIIDQTLEVPGELGGGYDALWIPENNPILQKGPHFPFDGIILSAPEGWSPELMVHRILQDWARIWPEAEWNILTAERLLRSTRRLSKTVGWVYGSVAGLSLVLGGVTLGSLMTLGVRQRQREIGLRLALGASPVNIFMLFLSEGFSVAVVSSILGILAAGSFLRLGWAPDTFPMSWGSITGLISMAVAILLGLISSLWPALVALRIAPAEAIRNE